jgi:hypothetical protein
MYLSMMLLINIAIHKLHPPSDPTTRRAIKKNIVMISSKIVENKLHDHGELVCMNNRPAYSKNQCIQHDRSR